MQELYADKSSFIHRLDARVKVVLTLAFLVLLSLAPSRAWPAYILFFAFLLSAILLSHLGVIFVFKRALLALPFTLAAVPLIFSGPPPHYPLAIGQDIQIVYSLSGLERFVSIAVKSWLSLQAAILLTATTPFRDLLIALKQLRVPRLFLAIVGLMWRYLFVIREEAVRMLRARSSRSGVLPGHLRSGGSVFWRARVTGGMAGSLFLRSLERSDRVYAAMLCRGYNGEPLALDTQPLSRKEQKTLILGSILLTFLWLLGLWLGG